MTRVLSSLPLLWALMLWPAIPLLRGLLEGGWYLAEMLHVSGVWSVRFLVLTVAVTPVTLLIGRLGHGAPLGRWLLKRRRHFGLASFVYAALHVAHYAVDAGTLDVVLAEATRLDLATGWIAFAIFLMLAITSNDRSVRRLGRRWKALHRTTYGAAALIYIHWVLLAEPLTQAFLWIALFAGVKAVHLTLRHLPRHRAAART